MQEKYHPRRFPVILVHCTPNGSENIPSINHWPIFSDEEENAENEGASEFGLFDLHSFSPIILPNIEASIPHISWCRRKGVLAPVGGEAEDPLGLDVESSGGGGFPEEQLQEMFPESSGEIGSERFDPAYFLLEHHHNTTFDDLKVKIQFSSLHCLHRLGWNTCAEQCPVTTRTSSPSSRATPTVSWTSLTP